MSPGSLVARARHALFPALGALACTVIAGPAWGADAPGTPAPPAAPPVSTWGAGSGAPASAAPTAPSPAPVAVPEAPAPPPDVAAPAPAPTPGEAAPPVAPPAPTEPVTPPALPPAPPPTESTEPDIVGFSMGIRGGYSAPFGASNGGSVADTVKGVVPIGLDAGYMLTPHLYVGVSFAYGFGITSANAPPQCFDPNTTCDSTLLRLGAVAHWHFRPEGKVDPWAGGGFGLDILNTKASDQSTGTTVESGSLSGLDFLTLEAGIDFKPKRFFGLGPYVELATGHYGSSTSSTALHEWLTFGVRLRTNL